MENLKTKWKLPGKTKKSPQPTGNWLRGNWKHSENSRIYSVFSQKNCPLPCQIPESGRESGHQVGETALKWLDNTVKSCPKIGWRNRWFSTIQQRKKTMTSVLSQSYGGDDQIWTGEWRFCRPLPYHLATSPYKWKLMFTNLHCFLERPTRLELATSTLARWRSTRWATAAGCVFFAKNTQEMVPPIGIEPMTRGFSVPCSTDWATEANGDPNQARTDVL